MQLSFEELPDLNLARASHHIIVVSQDKYVVVGVYIAGFKLTPTAETYDAETNEFTE